MIREVRKGLPGEVLIKVRSEKEEQLTRWKMVEVEGISRKMEWLVQRPSGGKKGEKI